MVKPSHPHASPLAGMSALVVDADGPSRASCVATLMAAGLDTTVADDFSAARSQLIAHPPAVLVAEIRLERYNGLHLAFLGRMALPRMAVVVTSGYFDPFVQRQASAIGAEFLLKPLSTTQLLAAVYRGVLIEPNADGTLGPALSDLPSKHYHALASPSARRERAAQARRRNISTFLWLESLKRGM
jgi:DNA-binding NtrC family response regulator